MLVTGASSGIGRAIAVASARAGADVAITYRHNRPGAEETALAVESAGRRAYVGHLDLMVPSTIDPLVDGVCAALGRVDAWVNNAGADILTGPLAERSALEKLDHLLQVDVRGTMLASWRAAELLGQQPRGGVIINMSWDHVHTGMAGLNPQLFTAVKGAVSAFSRSLARSVAPHVRVNILAPGWIETSFGSALDPEARRAVEAATPMGRWGRPEDVAAAAVFLASPAAHFLTGQTIFIGGGVVM